MSKRKEGVRGRGQAGRHSAKATQRLLATQATQCVRTYFYIHSVCRNTPRWSWLKHALHTGENVCDIGPPNKTSTPADTPHGGQTKRQKDARGDGTKQKKTPPQHNRRLAQTNRTEPAAVASTWPAGPSTAFPRAARLRPSPRAPAPGPAPARRRGCWCSRCSWRGRLLT